jgi:hypothetical protein
VTAQKFGMPFRSWSKYRRLGQMLRSTLGLISKRAAIIQENSGLTASCHNGLTEPEDQQLCLRVIFVGRLFHLVQVVYRDHLT